MTDIDNYYPHIENKRTRYPVHTRPPLCLGGRGDVRVLDSANFINAIFRHGVRYRGWGKSCRMNHIRAPQSIYLYNQVIIGFEEVLAAY